MIKQQVQVMKRWLAIGVLLSFLMPAAVANQSALPSKFSQKFIHSVGLLDSYRGDTSSLETARIELLDILKENPRYAPAHREMARYFIKRGTVRNFEFAPGSLEAADSAIKSAIEIDPNFAEAFVLRGHLYRLMKRHSEARAALEKADTLNTNDPWLQNNWADLLIDEGKYADAAQRYEGVINRKTVDRNATAAAFQGLTILYRRLGSLDKEDETHRKLILFGPDSAWVYGNYGAFLLCVRDDAEAAIVQFRKALEKMNYGVARIGLAASLYRKLAEDSIKSQNESGRAQLKEALSLGSGSPVEVVSSFCGGGSAVAAMVRAENLAKQPVQ